jgi:hypothetical protein
MLILGFKNQYPYEMINPILKPIQNIILTEDCIDFISPDEGIILLTRAWAQFGDNISSKFPQKTWNTYLMLKKLLNKTDGQKNRILKNHLRKYLNLRLKEKCNDTLFYIPANGDFGFSKIKREDIPDLEMKLNIESEEALKIVLCQFNISEEQKMELNSKEKIIHFIVQNII